MRRIQDRLGVYYGVLVTLIIAIGTWWVFFLSQETRNYERFQIQRFTTDQLHAVYLIQTVPEVGRNPVGMLQQSFPHLMFHPNGDNWQVQVDPAAHDRVHAEGTRRRRMFMAEGVTFLVLLLAGTTILTLAFRRERDFKRTRELFLAGATHEFKTPLASLRLYTETLNRPELQDDKRGRIRESMLQDVERLEGMVEQVLAVSREEETGRGPGEVLDLSHEAQLVLEDMEPFLEGHGARVETNLPENHRIRGHRNALAMALGNLVRNATLYSPPPARIHVDVRREGKEHLLSVRDEGPGIPRRERQRIFESFYRIEAPAGSLTQRPKGSGLGLYLVQRNVNGLGGRVDLESEEGRGSTFTISLPVCEEKS